MKMKKSLTILFFLFLLIILMTPGLTRADVKIESPIKYENIPDLINSIVNYIFWVGLALAPLMIVIGALMIMSSGGDPNKVTTGRNIIIYACIGLAIILFAKGIIAIIRGVLGVK
ncbi:hypothetical protein COS93_00220 [bacterium (Candidatus Gribaldobacteria) CG07_land_8_20_14_0_80_33_18]|uniref:TrbC/VIRB2 family protein n=1 Tax=bacterium (Candidatus Gribaldobacteria) CG07_land_8_20_14_0_80_33_18 TaxID=2014272 RepID=A0A2M6Z4F9_9BACT|nr:MAG: hypothetical protein COU04_02155 [bacterium (Candidatus Gribaldobacteria) CG10_big_fil_rev_8_21_14_0_10_33_41]PIU47276.1 MAG: hypothetical protein COS93_00220 [bacterium (Candidatus Gribaldobacteria) CG07_land_8_20_14_0_80_33_18]PJA00985.1 MAG: hypothetical protein COX75_01220 [bacterium (Candidatus Gribaldobacteria) CG_4_10_14_0_2_um_filter_33_15]PJB08740.1 MAG: hypothetical protein CO122_01110 [bacterium (Candidatus Gribaldobacteria) CG_4_9_14_3_um_filter_33_9]